MRRCIGCSRSLPKAELLRLARADEGGVVVDPEARREGRGAYVCGRPECAERAADPRSLRRSFRGRVTVTDETLDLIREWQRSASTR